MTSIVRRAATSQHPLFQFMRSVRRGVLNFSLPAPPVLIRPVLWSFVTIRSGYYWAVRVFVCEPLFKASCHAVGSNFHTGTFIHWVHGPGRIEVGNNVTINGKCSFMFARRFADAPLLRIGDGTYFSHDASITCAERVEIGANCLIAAGVRILDSAGHSTDPARRLQGLPPLPEEVKPVVIGNNVWLGADAAVMPGVTIGDHSIVASKAVVTRDVPPCTVVAGIPAKAIQQLTPPSGPATPSPAH